MGIQGQPPHYSREPQLREQPPSLMLPVPKERGLPCQFPEGVAFAHSLLPRTSPTASPNRKGARKGNPTICWEEGQQKELLNCTNIRKVALWSARHIPAVCHITYVTLIINFDIVELSFSDKKAEI